MVRDKPSLGRETVSHDPKDGFSFQIARYLFPIGRYVFPIGRYVFPIGRYVFQKVGYVLSNSSRCLFEVPQSVNNT